jgi:hypothetical protein
MISFQEQFMENKGRPFIYNGETIMMIDHYELPNKKMQNKD